MRKILLVIEEFNELVGLETLFRRLGFDVLSLGRDNTVTETVLGFPPDLVIATARSRSVSGLKLKAKMRTGARTKLVLLVRSGDVVTPEEISRGEVDALIDAPFEPRSALKVVAKLLQLPPEPLFEKYQKIVSARLIEQDEVRIVSHREDDESKSRFSGPGAEETAELAIPTAGAFPDGEPPKRPAGTAPLTAREERYKKFLEEEAAAELPPMASQDTMREARRKLALDSVNDAAELERLAQEKREFLKAMMNTAHPAAAETSAPLPPESGKKPAKR